MISQTLIDSVLGVEFSVQAHIHTDGGLLTLRVKSGHSLNGGEAATTAVTLETWDPATWDHFRDIARAVAPPLRPPEPSLSDALPNELPHY